MGSFLDILSTNSSTEFCNSDKGLVGRMVSSKVHLAYVSVCFMHALQ